MSQMLFFHSYLFRSNSNIIYLLLHKKQILLEKPRDVHRLSCILISYLCRVMRKNNISFNLSLNFIYQFNGENRRRRFNRRTGTREARISACIMNFVFAILTLAGVVTSRSDGNYFHLYYFSMFVVFLFFNLLFIYEAIFLILH